MGNRLAVLLSLLSLVLAASLYSARPADAGAFAPGFSVGNNYVLCYDTTTQGTAATDTVITFANEITDPGGLHSTVSNQGRLVASVAGTYRVWANLSVRNINTVSVVKLRKNGVDITGASVATRDISGAASASYYSVPIEAFVDLAVSDYVEVVQNGSGNDINNAGAPSGKISTFGMQRIK